MISLTIDDFLNVIDILQDELGYEFKISNNKLFNSISIYSDEYMDELYIKSFIYNKRPILIVSRICISKQRQGICSKLLDELINICNKNNFYYIKFESVITSEMLAFCKKHNFEFVSYDYFNTKEQFGDYIKSLKKI